MRLPADLRLVLLFRYAKCVGDTDHLYNNYRFEPVKVPLYNLFCTVYSWTNLATSLLAGLLVDKYGWFVFLFLSFASLDSRFGLTGHPRSTTSGTRFVIMFAGRFIFGMGGGSITIARMQSLCTGSQGESLP